MSQSLHDIKVDPRNADILISINGTLYPRDKATVSVFDSGFILGDGVWEGLRLVCPFSMPTLSGFTRVPRQFSWTWA